VVKTPSLAVSGEKIMIDWLFEPASNWLVIMVFILILFFLSAKDRVDRDRFNYITGVLNRMAGLKD
jgi:hypothetical protein